MTDVVLTNIARLNDLRARVLRGEEVPAEEYREVLIMCRNLRKERGASEEKPGKKKAPTMSREQIGALLSGTVGGQK